MYDVTVAILFFHHEDKVKGQFSVVRAKKERNEVCALAVLQLALQHSQCPRAYIHCVQHGKRHGRIRACSISVFFL